MLGDLFSGWHIIIVIAVVVLLFGATKLPVFSKSLGQSIKIFRKEMADVKDDIKEDRQKSATQPEQPVVFTAEPPATSTVRDATVRDASGR